MSKPCNCPDNVIEVRHGVRVAGHLKDCAHGEPRRYVWQDGRFMRVGFLVDYAQAWQHAKYAGDLDELSSEVRTWDESFGVTVTEHTGEFLEEDYMRYSLTIGNETVHVNVDGRV